MERARDRVFKSRMQCARLRLTFSQHPTNGANNKKNGLEKTAFYFVACSLNFHPLKRNELNTTNRVKITSSKTVIEQTFFACSPCLFTAIKPRRSSSLTWQNIPFTHKKKMPTHFPFFPFY